MKRASFWILLAFAAALAGCGGSNQTALPHAGTGSLQSVSDTNAVTASHWKLFRLPSTGQSEKVYSWPQRDGAIVAFGMTCCYPGGAPPSGFINGITPTGSFIANPPNANPSSTVGPVEDRPMQLFPCARGSQVCSIGKYQVFGPSGVTYTYGNQSVPDAVAGAGTDIWFTDCCNHTYIVHGSNGSMHFYRTLNSATDKTDKIARTADGMIWVTLQHVGSSAWIFARLNPATSAVTEYPFQLPTSPAQLLIGPDGNIWFALQKTLYRLNASNAQVSRFTLPQPSTGYFANGPGSTMWSAWANSISDQGLMEISKNGAVLGAFTCPLTVCARTPLHDTIQQLTEGPDGNIWFAYSNTTLLNQNPTDDLWEGFGVYVP